MKEGRKDNEGRKMGRERKVVKGRKKGRKTKEVDGNVGRKQDKGSGREYRKEAR